MLRRKMNFILLVFFALIFTACSSLKVSTDYDTSFDIRQLSTFHIISSTDKLRDTLTINRIDNALKNELIKKGYRDTDKKSADFLVYYHVNVTNKTQVVTEYQSMGMYPYRYRGMMVPTTRTYNYDEGKLIVDMLDPKNNNIIYRISVKDELKSFDTPKERTAYINNVVAQMLKDFPKK